MGHKNNNDEIKYSDFGVRMQHLDVLSSSKKTSEYSYYFAKLKSI